MNNQIVGHSLQDFVQGVIPLAENFANGCERASFDSRVNNMSAMEFGNAVGRDYGFYSRSSMTVDCNAREV